MSIWMIDTWEGEIMNAAPDEHDAIGWFTADDVGSLRLAHSRYPELLLQAFRTGM